MRGHIRMTSDIAYMIPQAMPNIPPVEYIIDGPLIGSAEYLNTPVCLDLKKLIAPTGLFIGKIRTGKSTSAMAILSRLHVLDDTSILIFDPHGEYSNMTRILGGTVIDMDENTLNPCKLAKNLSNKKKAMQLTDMLNTVFQLSEVQFPTLVDYITRGYDAHGDEFTFDILVDMIKNDFAKKSRDTITLGAILRRIELLSGSIFGSENSIPLENITSGITCIDVSKLDNNHLRNITMLSILQYIYNSMLSNQGREAYNPDGQTKLIIMIDEAGRIASDPSSVAVKLVKESGKFKIGLFFGIQDLPDIDSKILSNYGFVFVHKLDNHDYISRIQHDCSFTQDQASRIRTLPVGTAFLKLNFKDASVQSPFIVKVLRQEFDQPKINILNHQDKTSQKAVSQIKSDKIRGDLKNGKQVSSSTQNLNETETKLLQSISSDPTLNVTEHYQKIRVDSYYGNLARESLESKGYVRGRYLKGNGTKKGKILEVTEKAVEEFSLKRQTNRHGGPEHILLVNKIASRFTDCLIEKEFSIGRGKQVDLLINRKLAIEVESREFSIENVLKDLRHGFEKVIVVCKKEDLQKFKKDMESSGIRDSKVLLMTVDEILSKDTGELLG